jgi:hypothetical protein
MVWVEVSKFAIHDPVTHTEIVNQALVRRIIAEKGDISKEMYDEAKVDMNLADHPGNQRPQMSPTRLTTLHPHSRRITVRPTALLHPPVRN